MKKGRVFKMITAAFLAAALTVTPAGAQELVMEQDTAEFDEALFSSGGEVPVTSSGVEISAPSAILIEKETGAVIYEKNADIRLEPASVTKVMTILLIAEAVESGALSLEDTVTVSDRAASMGGSQVYLEPGEQMKVSEMLKCIVISSANDAAVAMAEHLAGTEEAFAARMTERARELGAANTTFTNCTGLLTSEEHRTTARDIALMSAELIKHDWIKEYTTIWMDTARDGQFTLSNTNKLVRFYEGCTGLKTGFTSTAGHCLAATAERGGVEFIAVVLNCPSSQERFQSASALLNFAFATYTLVPTAAGVVLKPAEVELGVQRYIQPIVEGPEKLLVKKTEVQAITREVEVDTELSAPVMAGEPLGKITVRGADGVIAEVSVVAGEGSERMTWLQIYGRMWKFYMTGEQSVN